MKPHPTSAPVCPPFRPSRSAAALALAAAALLGGCATTGPNANPADPFEDYNRGMSRFNEDVDKALLKPVATAYQDITPRPLRQGVSNALANLGDAWSLVNHLLQLNFTGAYTSAVRLSVNTVLGLGGLLDIATEAGVVRDKQDFGLTLARWGMPSGPYVVLPFFGASTVRDSVGLIADWKLDPTAVDHVRTRNSLYARLPIDWRTADTPAGQARLKLCRTLSALRRSEKALTRGGLTWLDNDRPAAVLSFRRGEGAGAVVSVINLSGEPVKARVNGVADSIRPLLAKGGAVDRQGVFMLEGFGSFIGRNMTGN